VIDWLLTNALGALALAAVAGMLIWTFRPAPAVRHALWLVVLLKLVLPTGPTISLPVADPTPPPEPKVVTVTAQPQDVVVEEELFTVQVQPKPGQTAEDAAALVLRTTNKDEATDARSGLAVTPIPATEPPPAKPFDYRPGLLGAWALGAVLIGWRQLRDTARFARFARQARPAADHLVAEVAIVANRLGVRVPAVRVLAGLTSPVMWCLGRPVLLWPAGLECRLKGQGRQAVIAHELAHLRRRDHWVRRLEMVAAVLHWWNPLFWVARKKLRADAELACDAWAAGQADRRAYAEALLEVCSFNPRRRPAPAVGVFGEGRRAMQERLTMIMRDHVPCRLAFGAKLVVALMAVAAVPAWTLGQGKPEVVAEDVYVLDVSDSQIDDAQLQALEAQIKALAQKLEALKASKQAEAQKATDKQRDAQKKLAEKVKELKLRLGDQKEVELYVPKTVIGGTRVLISGQDGVKVIGPDGKEIKDAKVIIGGAGGPAVKPPTGQTPAPEQRRIELRLSTPDGQAPAGTPRAVTGTVVAPSTAEHARSVYTFRQAGGSQTITLSRATYKLGKDQASALGTLLGSIKATVMETKVDGDSVTVTTTPEVQQAIGQIVRLIQGQGGPARVEWRVAPAPAQGLFVPRAPATPAVPGVPATPATPRPAPAVRAVPVKPGAGPDAVDVKALVEKALKDAGVGKEPIDAAKLQDMLKSLKALDVESDRLKALKALDLEKLKSQTKPAKPAPEKKPGDGDEV
jgi:beta-lactamase regulating signal transducer with metallopeptidase domain